MLFYSLFLRTISNHIIGEEEKREREKKLLTLVLIPYFIPRTTKKVGKYGKVV